MELEFDYPDAGAIPVPDDAAPGWAAQAAAGFRTRTGCDEAFAERISAALDDLAALAEPDRRTLLLVSTAVGALAPLTVFVSDAPLTADEQAAFLWSASAALPPTPLRTPTDTLGQGFSATLLQREGEREFATRRWLFFGADHTVGALLGPVLAAAATAALEPIAEAILERTRVPGFVPVADDTRIRELEAACVKAGETWKF